MFEKQEIVEINKEELLAKVSSLSEEGYRIVQIGCTKLSDKLQVDYTFDKDDKFYGLRLGLPLEKLELPSVSGIYLAACLYENEMHDLFGVKVSGMAIDFGGKFYRIEAEAPFMNTAEAETKGN
jgi:ech hydrogenase subunit D